MVKHAAFGMKIRRLLASDRRRDFRQHLVEQTALAQQIEAARGLRRVQQFQQFVSYPLGADDLDFWRIGFERG